MKLNISMQSNNVERRENAISSVLFNARTLVLTLAITMTMVMGTALFTNSIAYAQSGDGATVRVATFDQLRDALGNGGVSDIIIDPQAAEEFADNEGAEISFDGSDVFYIPIEYPLVVSHDVTISSEVAVNFARSGNGGSGKYDSRAFRGQNEVTPALFNVDQGKTLELSGDIAMTGEEVSATFDSAEGSFLFTVKARDNLGDDEDGNEAWSYGSDPGKLSTGGYFIYTKGGNVVVNDDILLMGLNTKDNVKDIAPVYIDGTARAATLTVDGAEIVDNNLGQTEDGNSTAGAVILKGSNATAALNSGEISNNNADVAGIIVKEEAELELGNDFGINDSDIYDEKAEEAAKEEADEEEAAEEETKEETVEEAPIVAPKKSLKSSKAPATQMRSTGAAATSKTVIITGNPSDYPVDGAIFVTTWTAAVEALGTDPGTIYLTSTNNVSGTIATKNPAQQVVKRAGSYEIRDRLGENHDLMLKHYDKYYISYNQGQSWELISEMNSGWQSSWDNGVVKDTSVLKGTAGLPSTINKVFKGVMFDVNGSATFKDIHVDGDTMAADNTCIKVDAYETLNILSGARFERLRNMGDGYGGVIRIGFKNGDKADGAKVYIDGGVFEDNEAKFEGGVISASGTVKITVRSGAFRRNKAHAAAVIANYDARQNNNIELYNAVIRYNHTNRAGQGNTYEVADVYKSAQDNYNPNDIFKDVWEDRQISRVRWQNVLVTYGQTDGSAGGVNLCIHNYAQAKLFGGNGVAIYGNTGDKGDIGVWTYDQNMDPKYWQGVGNITAANLNQHLQVQGDMLGGGSHNWADISYHSRTLNGVTYYVNGKRSNPSSTSNVDSHATTIIENNLSHYHGAIQSNSLITFGREKAALELKKINSETNDILSGVTFDLYKNGTKVKSATTNARGIATFTDLDNNASYELREQVPSGFVNSGTRWTVNVTNGYATVVGVSTDDQGYYVIENTPIVQVPIELKKVGEGNDANGLSGVTFKLYKANVNGDNNNHTVQFNTEQTVTSGNGGIINLGTLDNGTYLLFEASVPSKYKRQVDPWRIVVNNGTATVYTLTGGRDSTDRAPGTATGWHWKRNVGERRTTLPDGNYTEAYFADKVWPGFYFSGTALADNKLSNEKISISFTKVKQNNTSLGETITGVAKFAIYEADKTPGQVSSNGTSFNNNVAIGKKPGGITQTNLSTSNGVLNISNLDGEKLYLLFETEAPAGYAKSKAPWLVYVKADGTYRLFKHNSTNADATSWSTGASGNNFSEIEGNNAGKLGNTPVEFSFTKGDRTDSSVSIDDAQFVLYHATRTNGTPNVYTINTGMGTNGKVDGVVEAGADGKYVLPITPPASGTAYYMLFETTAREGYVLPKAPWGIAVTSYGDAKAYKMIDAHADNFEAKYVRDFGDKLITQLSKSELQTISINCDTINQDTQGKLVNEKKPIQLTKVAGKVNNNTVTLTEKDGSKVFVAGAKFQLYKARNVDYSYWHKGEAIGEELTSDENGVITLPQEVMRLNGGNDVDYWLEEISAAPGYKLSTRPWILNINQTTRALNDVYWPKNDPITENGVTKVASGVNNVQYMKPYVFNEPVEFTKVSDSNDNWKLSNVEFELYNAVLDGQEVTAEIINSKNWSTLGTNGDLFKAVSLVESDAPIKSDANGRFTLPITSAGVYLLFEKAAADGHERMKAPWLIAVGSDGSITFATNKNPDFVKKGSDPSTTNTDAMIVTQNRWWPLSYYEVSTGLVLKNKLEPIELYKVDETTDANRLGGAEFVICEAERDQNSNYWVKGSKNSNGGWVDGATVMSTARKENGQAKVYTSSNEDATKGKIVIDDLEGSIDGKYYLLFETKAPNGFVRSTSPWVIKVTDTSAGRSVVVKKIADASNQGKVLVPGGNDAVNWVIVPDSTSASDQTVKERWWADAWYETFNSEPYNLVNKPKYLTKVDSAVVGDPDGGTGLSGAQFELFKAYRGTGTNSGSYFYRKDGNKIDTYTTGTDGKINLPSSVTAQNGWYLLFETSAPDGYKRTYTPWLLTVDTNGNITVQRFNGDKLKLNYVDTVYGYQTIDREEWWEHGHFLEESWNDKYRVPNVPNDVTITKVDGYNNSKKLKGAQFEIFSYERTSNNEYQVKESKGLTSISDENGRFTLPVTDGKYLMFEKQAPDGYILSDKPWWIEITRSTDWHGITSVRVRIVPARDDTPSGTWPDGDWAEKWWTFCEDQTYDLVKNYPSINLTKLDLESVTKAYDSNGRETVTLNTENPTIYLEGVKFKLFKAKTVGSNPKTATWTKETPNQPIMVDGAESDGTIKTKQNGVLDLGNLANGNYILEETEAKGGYNLPEHPWRLVVHNGTVKVYVPSLDGNSYIETAHNHYLTNVQIYDLPKTGGMGTYWFMIIGALMMGFAVTAGFTKLNLLSIFRR